jgi:hypothetical protein
MWRPLTWEAVHLLTGPGFSRTKRGLDASAARRAKRARLLTRATSVELRGHLSNPDLLGGVADLLDAREAP